MVYTLKTLRVVQSIVNFTSVQSAHFFETPSPPLPKAYAILLMYNSIALTMFPSIRVLMHGL